MYLATFPSTKAIKRAYLPSDEWVDLFTGKVYEKETLVKKDETNLREMPLFIRGGSIIPLVKEANRALKLDYSKLTLDYYPSFNNEDHQVLYEDDNVTTAYKLGEFRKTYLDSYFDRNENALTVHISKAIGNFNNEINERKIILRFNLFIGTSKFSKYVVFRNWRFSNLFFDMEFRYKVFRCGKDYSIYICLSSGNSNYCLFSIK